MTQKSKSIENILEFLESDSPAPKKKKKKKKPPPYDPDFPASSTNAPMSKTPGLFG